LHSTPRSTLQAKALQLATLPNIDLASFRALARFTSRHEALALERERLALKRKEFEFNAARTAIEHAWELQEIAREPELDDEDKIRRARERVFGPNLPD
jgi:hypothetical protein